MGRKRKERWEEGKERKRKKSNIDSFFFGKLLLFSFCDFLALLVASRFFRF